MSHPLQATTIGKRAPMPYRDVPVPPQWPSFTGTAQFVGTSPSGRVTVYVDPTLGPPGMTNAQDLVNDADRVVGDNDTIFGSTGGPVSVIVFALGGATNGTGGADHAACDFVNGAAIEVCASFGNSARISALLEAEYSECSMGGNLCGESTGEALSRWCAAVVGNNALSDFATAPQWFQDGTPDYVNNTDPTDQNADSTGCGMAFLSWLMSQGHSLSQIAQAMVSLGDSGTLAQLYANLTGDSAANAFPNFIAAVQALPNGVTNDDPFNGAAQPAQVAHLAPWTVELAGKIFAAILADLAAGKAAHQIAASVRAVMVGAPNGRGAQMAKMPTAQPPVCSIGSHRLVPPGRPLRAAVVANGPMS
ncbi:MAG: hypothetical protein JOZ29_04400 [Deltaproteobacteria bacterium]|nr:hypothetical protein [Deltaproteobacteria bacterium]